MRPTILTSFIASLLLTTPMMAASAPATGIVGTWQQVDDESHEVRSLVQITEQNGLFEGKMIKLFPHPDEQQEPICGQCTGDKKNAPYLGLKIIENVRKTADGYTGGKITDPDDGTEYKLKLTPSADGNTLEVKGYVGIELMGRTQVWRRQK
eukprot:gene6970-biopygen4446